MKNSNKGFSLIELLVALSILAVVAAIIVPKFLNVRSNASQAVAIQNMRELQNTCRQWIALGGSNSSTTIANCGDVLNFLSGNGAVGVRATATTGATAQGGATDSQGTMGSWTIQLNSKPGTNALKTDGTATAANIAAITTPGFYVAANTAGSTGFYCDGTGDAWSIAIAANGDITATALTNCAKASGAMSL